MGKFFTLLLLSASLLSCPVRATSQVNTQDSLALVDLYNNTGGPGWTFHGNWLTGLPVDTWFGVIVSNGRVTQISLPSNNLSGAFPAAVLNLTALTRLLLWGNHLTGSIPAGIGSLSALTWLHLADNQLTGSIPTSIGDLGNCTDLTLYNNQLTGSIPPSMGQLSSLQNLDISGNQLIGKIPAELGNLSHLLTFQLFRNRLSDTLPASLGNLTHLTDIEFDRNEFSGPIPSFLGNLSQLGRLVLSSNRFSGPVPASLANLSNTYIDVANNYLNFDGMNYVSTGSPYSAYAPQHTIPLRYNNHDHVLSVNAGGTLGDNTYTWYKNGLPISTVTGDSTLTIPAFAPNDSFRVTVTNSISTALTLYSDTLTEEVHVTIPATTPGLRVANREFTDSAAWTHYYFDNNTPADISDDSLLLSLKKNGQDIGRIGDGSFQLSLAETASAGTNTGIKLTSPLISNPSGYWVMNRYWVVHPTHEPSVSIGVRFYYSRQDLADVNGSFPQHNLTDQQLIFYKTLGGNPDPAANLAGATGIISILPGAAASDTSWTYHPVDDSTKYGEYSVAGFSGGGGGGTGNGAPLPLQLLALTGGLVNGKAVLNWQTNNEKNTAWFGIEYSKDGKSFLPVGRVIAAGACSCINAYTFTDNTTVTGNISYRLKMVDLDNNFTYSKTIRIAMGSTPLTWKISPDPAIGSISVDLQNASPAKKIKFQILTTEGIVLQERELPPFTGSAAIFFEISALAKGTYIMLLKSDQIQTKQFIKL